MNELTKRKKDMGGMLEKMKDRMAQVLPKHVTPERLVKTALVAINKTPKLLEATPESVCGAMMNAASLGLDVSGVLGSAYLVPFNVNKGDQDNPRWVTECQLIIGYRGMIELARRSGEIKRVESHVVYSNEHFECEYGLHPRLEHRPNFDNDRGEFRCVYAIAELTDGATQVEVMTKHQIDLAKQASQTGRKGWGPWIDHYDEMARKTVVRRLCKYLPLSPELVEALTLEATADNGESQPIDVDIIPDEALNASKSDRMAERLGAGEADEYIPENVDPETGEVINSTEEEGDQA